MSATKYRLPDWLGGHEVERVGDDGKGRAIVEIQAGEHAGERLAVRDDRITEIRPPSIDDPVSLPLEVRMVQLKGLPETTLRLSAVGHDAALDVELLGNDGHEGYLAGRLLGDDALLVAQAVWQHWQRATAEEAS